MLWDRNLQICFKIFLMKPDSGEMSLRIALREQDSLRFEEEFSAHFHNQETFIKFEFVYIFIAYKNARKITTIPRSFNF